MSDLAVYQSSGLPDTVEDLAHFLLIAPEKATAMRAEIRAIQKVGLAKAVYDQKLEEQRRLCDMILDASVRLGEMTKAIPKASADRGNQYTGGKTTPPSISQKTKTDAIRDLGFSPKQVERFETLAENKDLVELEKARAREEGRMPTRTNVLNLAQERKKRYDHDIVQIDKNKEICQRFIDIVYAPFKLPDSPAVVAAVMGTAEGLAPEWLKGNLDALEQTIQMLKEIQILLKKEAHRNGQKSNHQ